MNLKGVDIYINPVIFDINNYFISVFIIYIQNFDHVDKVEMLVSVYRVKRL